MKFKQPDRKKVNVDKYKQQEMDLALSFTKTMKQEFGTFIKAVVMFGSSARKQIHKKGDIDILVIVDDVGLFLTPEFVQAYRLITQKTIADTSTKLHVISLKLTTFWEYVRAGDPVGINMLRDGVVILDSGIFEPMQILLKQGRIRPSQESIWTYFGRAPRTLNNSRWHITQATLDLYWAVIDAAHAALMKVGEIPPTPEHVADMMEQTLVKKNKLEPEYAKTMREFYKLMKMITHREIKEVTGKEFEKYYQEAADFVERMKAFIDYK